MRTSILTTATTEQMGQGIVSFFVYTKSTNYYSLYALQVLNSSTMDMFQTTMAALRAQIDGEHLGFEEEGIVQKSMVFIGMKISRWEYLLTE